MWFWYNSFLLNLEIPSLKKIKFFWTWFKRWRGSNIRIRGIQCVLYADFLGTCICLPVSSTFATKNTYIFRPARLPKPKIKQICQDYQGFFSSNQGAGAGGVSKSTTRKLPNPTSPPTSQPSLCFLILPVLFWDISTNPHSFCLFKKDIYIYLYKKNGHN